MLVLHTRSIGSNPILSTKDLNMNIKQKWEKYKSFAQRRQVLVDALEEIGFSVDFNFDESISEWMAIEIMEEAGLGALIDGNIMEWVDEAIYTLARGDTVKYTNVLESLE